MYRNDALYGTDIGWERIMKKQEQKAKRQFNKGFRDGYNNPGQYKDIDLDRISHTNYFGKGAISGSLTRHRDCVEGQARFIRSPQDLKDRLNNRV